MFIGMVTHLIESAHFSPGEAGTYLAYLKANKSKI